MIRARQDVNKLDAENDGNTKSKYTATSSGGTKKTRGEGTEHAHCSVGRQCSNSKRKRIAITISWCRDCDTFYLGMNQIDITQF